MRSNMACTAVAWAASLALRSPTAAMGASEPEPEAPWTDERRSEERVSEERGSDKLDAGMDESPNFALRNLTMEETFSYPDVRPFRGSLETVAIAQTAVGSRALPGL